MGIYRSYFLKNNTIVRDQQVNTAKNPATEIRYGRVFTKFLLQLDLDGLQAKVNNGDIPTGSTTHHLHMTNCIFGDEALLGEIDMNVRRTSSFDLILFKIPEAWDEGVGYDFANNTFGNPLNNVYAEGASNWTHRMTASGWTESGVYSTHVTGTTADIIAVQHFDNGNENLHVDITNYINGILLSGATDHGIGVAFAATYELLAEQEYDQSVSFFTKYTNTFFEPYLETKWDDRIEDNRSGFLMETSQNLCLYVTHNGLLTDLDTPPTVDLLDFDRNAIEGYTDLTATKVSKGIYQVSVALTGVTLCENKIYMYDVWKGLSIGGRAINNQTLKFIPAELEDGISFTGKVVTKKYVPFIYGIAKDERIVRGDRRKITVECKEIMGGKKLLNEVYYRIYVREGMTEVDVVEWTQVNRTDVENNFFLDTEFLIPKEYFMDVKIQENNEITTLKEQLKFHIVNQK